LSYRLLLAVMMSCELLLDCLLFNDGKSVMSLLDKAYMLYVNLTYAPVFEFICVCVFV